jgi:hypothetical protein
MRSFAKVLRFTRRAAASGAPSRREPALGRPPLTDLPCLRCYFFSRSIARWGRTRRGKGAARLGQDFLIPPAGTQPIKNESSRAMLSIFFAKTRMGWKEAIQHEGKDGGPIIWQSYPEDEKL